VVIYRVNHMKKPGTSEFYGWKLTGILFFINLGALGIGFYGFTVIFPAMVKAMGWGRGEASLAATLRPIFMSVAMPIAASVINRYGTRRSIMLGLFILSLGMFLLGTVTSRLWQWIFLWGIFIPFGFAFFNLGSQTTVTFWFNVKRATIMGVVMTGTSIGGFLATPIFTWLMQRTKMWQPAWLVAGGLALLMLIFSFWIRGKPSDIGQHPDNIEPETEDERSEEQKRGARTFRTPVTWQLSEILKTPSFYFITAGQIATIIPLQILVTHMVFHLTDLGYTEMEAASVMSIVVLSSGFARFPMGWVGDRIEPRWLMSGSLVIILTMVFNVWKAPSLTTLLISGVFYGFSYGTILVLLPVIRGNYFGPESFASLAALITPITLVFVAPAPYLGGFVADKFGNYDLAFISIFVVVAIGVICIALAAPPQKHVQMASSDE